MQSSDLTADRLGLPWWTVWYHFPLLIAVGVCGGLGKLKQYSQVLGHFLAALFALQMYTTHTSTIISRMYDSVCASRLVTPLLQPTDIVLWRWSPNVSHMHACRRSQCMHACVSFCLYV
jgi:hypothetical protein